MKKIFTLIAMAMMAVAVHADITIYVQATTAPYLYVWNGADNGDWPGTQMTETAVVKGTTFWKKTFAGSGFNIIFNNGAGIQTKDITGIISDRYFTFDPTNSNKQTNSTDVTKEYGGEIPDATITSLKLAGNHTTPAWGEGAVEFTEVTPGTKYTITVDLTGITCADKDDKGADINEGFWHFKLIANGGTWFGYSSVNFDAQPTWLKQAISDDNFEVDQEDATLTSQKFTITATWAGGKEPGENWTVKFENSSSTGINDVNTDAANSKAAPVYNLGGQRVNGITRGVVIQNGKKIVK